MDVMSFLLPCPNCGKRSVYEFQFGGEVRARPVVDAPREAWTSYLYWRDNSPGLQKEWWYHKLGCKVWFVAERNTTSNQVQVTDFAEQAPASDQAVSDKGASDKGGDSAKRRAESPGENR